MVTRLVKFPGCFQYLKVPADQLSRLIMNGKVLKKLFVLDGQEKCLLGVKPDWSAWWKKNRGKVLRDIATEFNIGNGDHSVSERTVQRYLHKNRIYRRIVKKRMVVKEINRKKQLTWCLQKRRWTVNENWRHIIFSDESQIVIG